MNYDESAVCLVYVGTYAGGGGKGIYSCQLDLLTGGLRLLGVTRNIENPSYLAIDAERLRLFAVNEVAESDGRPGGSVSAFAIKPSSGELSFINQQFSRGGAPCYLTLGAASRYLLVANYLGGNVAVLPIAGDGALGEPREVIQHMGSSVHPERQEAPHPHSVILDSRNQYAFVPDLGLDRVMQYRFDRHSGRLAPNQPPWCAAEPGSGPRHMVFHPSGKHAYIINELSSTITAYAYDADRGALRSLQTVSTLPEGYSGANTAADLQLTPDGRYLLGSNRGHDSLAQFAVDRETGTLSIIDSIPTRGQTPRGFAVDATGTFILVANQDSDSIVTFRIAHEDGTVTATGNELRIPSPVCLKLVSLPEPRESLRPP
jgi:6-phosphogluconolactonase